MLEESVNPVGQIEVLADGTIQVREQTLILRDGKPISNPIYHRYVLRPGDQLRVDHPRIAAISLAVWTPEVIAARKKTDADAVLAEQLALSRAQVQPDVAPAVNGNVL